MTTIKNLVGFTRWTVFPFRDSSVYFNDEIQLLNEYIQIQLANWMLLSMVILLETLMSWLLVAMKQLKLIVSQMVMKSVLENHKECSPL